MVLQDHGQQNRTRRLRRHWQCMTRKLAIVGPMLPKQLEARLPKRWNDTMKFFCGMFSISSLAGCPSPNIKQLEEAIPPLTNIIFVKGMLIYLPLIFYNEFKLYTPTFLYQHIYTYVYIASTGLVIKCRGMCYVYVIHYKSKKCMWYSTLPQTMQVWLTLKDISAL